MGGIAISKSFFGGIVFGLLVVASLVYQFRLVNGVDRKVLRTMPPSMTPAPSTTIPQELLPLFKNPRRSILLDRARYDAAIFQQGHTFKFPQEAKGIILCLFNDMVAAGFSLIQELRSLGNTRPIQIYHCYEELSSENRELLMEADKLNRTETIEICTLLMNNRYMNSVLDALEYQSYYIKILALLHTSFDEVMLLDADDIFFQNPDVLWSIPSYQKTGTLFFYDRQIDFKQFFDGPIAPDNNTLLSHLYEEFPYGAFFLERPKLSAQILESKAWQKATSHEQDSSVVVFHKSKVGLKVLQVLWHLVHHLRIKYENGISWGDKEYFWLSCFLASAPYSFSPYAASVVSLPDDIAKHPNTLCGSLAHYLPIKSEKPQLLYINGKNIIVPCTDCPEMFHYKTTWEEKAAHLRARVPLFVSPRQTTRQFEANRGDLDQTCLINQGAIPIEIPGFGEHVNTRINNTCYADSRVTRYSSFIGMFFKRPHGHPGQH